MYIHIYLETNVGHKRTLSSTFKQLEEQGHNV
jgi:hypothetical protein